MSEKRNIFWTCERTAVAPNSYPGVWEYSNGSWTRYPLPNGGEAEPVELYCIDGSREENIWVAGKDSAGKIYVARRKYGGSWTRFATTSFPNANAVVIGLDVRNDRMVTIDCEDGPIYYNGSGFSQVGGATRTMASNSFRQALNGNNTNEIAIFTPNALFDSADGGTWQLLGPTDYGPDVGLPINNISCVGIARYNTAFENTGPVDWPFSYFWVVGRNAAREIWKKGTWHLMHKEVTLSDEHASVFSVPYKKIDTTKTYNVYYLTAKAGGGAQWVYGISTGAQTNENWNQVNIAGIVPTGGFHSIDDNNHLGCGTRYIFHIKKQDGSSYESLQPTGSDNTQIYSDVWGYQKNVDRAAIVVPDPPVADKIHAWATGWGVESTASNKIWLTVFEFNGLEWIDRTTDLPNNSYPSSGFSASMQAVIAIAPDDIWFVSGGNAIGYSYYPVRMWHYDGKDFTEVANPIVSIHWKCYGITGIATNDIYFSVHQGGLNHNSILHWDGTSITNVADDVFGYRGALRIIQVANGDLYAFGGPNIFVLSRSKGTWFREDINSYGEDDLYSPLVFAKPETDGEIIYIASQYRIYKGIYGDWKQLHEDNTINSCGLSVFPNGDVYWYSVAYPNTYMSTVINDVKDTINGQGLRLQHYDIDPTAVLGSARQEHMLAAQSWLTDEYLGSTMTPISICDTSQSFTKGIGFTAWLESSKPINSIIAGQGGNVISYNPNSKETVRMNSVSFNEKSTSWTSILYLDPDDIWISGGIIPIYPYDNTLSILCHFDGRKWSRIGTIGIGEITSCCLHGNNKNNIFTLLKERGAGRYATVYHWNGITYTGVIGVSQQGWGDFGVYGDNAASKLYVLADGSIYLIGRYVHYLPPGSVNWQHGDVSDWQHEDPTGCSWYTGNNWDIDWVMGIDFDGTNIYIAKGSYGIWKGTFGSWEKVYTFTNGESGWASDNLLQCADNGDIYCGSNNGYLVKYDAATDTWSSTLISDPSGTKTHHSISYVDDDDLLYSAIHLPSSGTDSVVKIDQDLEVIEKIPYINEGGPGFTFDPPMGFLALYSNPNYHPPYIINKDPIPNSTTTEKNTKIYFSIRDNLYQVVLDSIRIYIKGEFVYSSTSGFAENWKLGSSITSNSFNGFDFKFFSNVNWGNSEIDIRVIAQNIVGASIDEKWIFTMFLFDIWRFLMQSMRDLDRKEGNLLVWRWLQGMQIEWEATYNRIKSLNEINDPKLAPTEALQYLKWIVGLTSKLDFLTGGLSESDLRILIAIAVRMWKYNGTPNGFIEAIEAMSAEQVRFLDWFFFRVIIGEMEIGHAELDVDIWLLDQPGMQTSIYPDGLIVTKALDMKVLPSAADPLWSYISVNGGVEGTIFNISNEKLNHVQTTSDAVGGFYQLEDLGLNPLDIQMGAVWIPETITAVTDRPWFIKIVDGTRAYKLSWSDVEIAIEDEIGNVIAGPRSFRFVAGESYRIRIAKSGSNIVASLNGNDLFGNVDSTLFWAVAFSGYEFGFGNNENQNWIVDWDDVGPTPILNFDISTLLGLTEAVPHAIRVHYTLKNIVRTVYSYWDGSKNRCNVTDAFGLDLPILTNSLNDFRVGVDPDEFVSDLKVVDDGNLDRDMIENLVRVMRPAGERIYIRYLAFQDTFRRAGNWEIVSGSVTEDFDNGELTVNAGSVIKTDMNLDSTWKNITARAQAKMKNVIGDWWEMRFNYLDEDNFYSVGMNPADIERSVFLDKNVAGVRTNIGDHNFTLNFLPDVYYNLMVQTEWNSTTTLIKVFLDGNYLFEFTDSTFEQGKVAIATNGTQEVTLSLVEVSMCPHDHSRIGPPPDGPPLNNNVCII